MLFLCSRLFWYQSKQYLITFFSPNSFRFTFREIRGHTYSHLGVNSH